MKIEKVETEIVDIMFFPGRFRQQIFVRLTTDDGLTGIGEAYGGAPPRPVDTAVTDLLAPLLIGEDSRRMEYLWQKMYRSGYRYGTEGVVNCAISGVDLALWDLMGKRLGVPAAELLGGRVKDGVRVYASFPALRDEQLLRDNLEKIMTAGFMAVKLHDVDEQWIALARDVVGRDFTIMVDAHGLFSGLETEAAAKWMEKYNIYWLEEPIFPMQDHAALARARRGHGLRFAAGENEYTLAGYYRLMKSGAADYIQPEIGKIGLTLARKLAVLGELLNYPVCPHCYIVGPAFYAGIQLGLTQAKMDWQEMKWLPAGYEHAVVPPPKLVDGRVLPPEGPGLGTPME